MLKFLTNLELLSKVYVVMMLMNNFLTYSNHITRLELLSKFYIAATVKNTFLHDLKSHTVPSEMVKYIMLINYRNLILLCIDNISYVIALIMRISIFSC